MKRKLNKRLLSAVLAVVMLITAIPLYAVSDTPKADDEVLLTVEGDSAYPYLDGFFVVNGNNGEKAEVSYVNGNYKEAKKLGEFRSVNYADDSGLEVVTLEGNTVKLFPNGKTYSDSYKYSDTLLIAVQNKDGIQKYGLIDKNGEPTVECKWKNIAPLTEDYSVLTAYGENGNVDETIAIADNSGKIILNSIKAGYIDVVADNGGDVIFAFNDGTEKLFFPESGKVLTSGGAYDPETGLIPVKNDDGFYGYADGQGKLVVDYQYALAESFSDGVAAVCDKTTMLWGYIGSDGSVILDFKYNFAGEFGEGLAFVEETETLPEETEPPTEETSEEIPTEPDSTEESSTEEIPSEPDSTEESSSEETPSEPDSTEEPSSEEIPSEPDSTEESSSEEIPSEPDSTEEPSSEEASSEDTTENTETDPSAEHPELYAETVTVRKVIDKSGEAVFELPDDVVSAEPYYGGYAVVINSNGQYGLIDKEGKLAVPYGDDIIERYGHGAYTVTKGTSEYFVINGEISDLEKTDYNEPDDEYIIARKNGKYGIVNSKFENLIDFEYDGVSCDSQYPYLFSVKKGEKWAAADKSGKVITDYIFDDAFYNINGVSHIVSSDGTVYKSHYTYNDSIVMQIENEDGQFGLLNRENGELLLGGKFYDCSEWELKILDNVCVLEQNGKNTLLNISDGFVISANLGAYRIVGNCIVSETNVVYDLNGNKAYYLAVSTNGLISDYSSSSNVFAVYFNEQTTDGDTKSFVKFVKARPYDIEKVEIVQLPAKTEFIENMDGYGEPFSYSVSLEGLAVKVTYTDGTSETVTFDYENSAFSYDKDYCFESVGEYNVPFSYLGVDLSFTVKVIENPLTKIEVVTPPAQTQYISGSLPDLGGAVLRLTYSDGTTADISLKQNEGCFNEYYDAFLEREELISWRWENPEVQTSLGVSGKQNIIISYFGREAVLAVDVSENLTQSIKVKGGHSENLVIIAANSDETETEFTVLDFISHAGGENEELGSLVTDKGIFTVKLFYEEAENGHHTYNKLELFGKEGNIPDNSTFLEIVRVSQNFDFLSVPFGVNLTSFTGSVTKENIDAVVSLAFYNADGRMKLEPQLDEKTGKYVYYVPKADAEKYVGGMFKVKGAIDFTLSENYDNTAETIAVPDLAYGYGPLTTEKSYRFENGLWYAECDGYPIGKITTVFDFDSGKITAYYFNEKKIEAISVNKNPYKYEYIQGDPLNTAGLEIAVLYSDGTKKLITSGFETSGYDPNKLGEQTVKVTFAGKETAFKVKVVEKRPPQPETPDKITSDKYKIENGYILDIPAGTSVDTLLKGINESAYVKVFDGNTEVRGNTLVGTKMVMKLMDGTHIKQTLILSVRGDNSGEGKISITDMIAVKSHLLGKTNLNGAAFYASDINRDKKVTITDFIQIKSHLLGKSQIK